MDMGQGRRLQGPDRVIALRRPPRLIDRHGERVRRTNAVTPRSRENRHILRIDIREVPADGQGIRHGGNSPIDSLTASAKFQGISVVDKYYTAVSICQIEITT